MYTLTFTTADRAAFNAVADALKLFADGQVNEALPPKPKPATKIADTTAPAAKPEEEKQVVPSFIGKKPKEEPAATTLTLTDIQNVTMEVVTKKGKPAAVELLKKYGGESSSTLAVEKYDAYSKAARELLSKKDDIL